MRYTDVDRLILDRWTEVVALKDALNELLERMRDAIEVELIRAVRWADEHGLRAEYDVKAPSFDVWRPEWATKKGEAAIYFRVFDFAPWEYGAVKGDHPWVSLCTDELYRFKVSEADRVNLGRDLVRALAPPLLQRWDHPNAIAASEPLRRQCVEIDDAQRVKWMSSPGELAAFIASSVEDAMTLAPALDPLIAQLRRGNG